MSPSSSSTRLHRTRDAVSPANVIRLTALCCCSVVLFDCTGSMLVLLLAPTAWRQILEVAAAQEAQRQREVSHQTAAAQTPHTTEDELREGQLQTLNFLPKQNDAYKHLKPLSDIDHRMSTVSRYSKSEKREVATPSPSLRGSEWGMNMNVISYSAQSTSLLSTLAAKSSIFSRLTDATFSLIKTNTIQDPCELPVAKDSLRSHCQSDEVYMSAVCPQNCNALDISLGCSDFDSDQCMKWASQGECATHATRMSLECSRACAWWLLRQGAEAADLGEAYYSSHSCQNATKSRGAFMRLGDDDYQAYLVDWQRRQTKTQYDRYIKQWIARDVAVPKSTIQGRIDDDPWWIYE